VKKVYSSSSVFYKELAPFKLFFVYVL
jgi:hypothetical protein